MGANLVVRDRGLTRILETARAQAGTSYVMVGILGGDDRGGLHVPGADLTVAEIAVVNEFGTQDGRIPARSFVRITYDRMRPELEAIAFKLVWQITDGKMSVEQALNILGAKLASAIHHTVTDGSGVPPPNAPSTLRRKEAAGEWNERGEAQAAGWGVRPLVDTGRMLNSIGWGVFTPRAGRRPIEHVEPMAK